MKQWNYTIYGFVGGGGVILPGSWDPIHSSILCAHLCCVGTSIQRARGKVQSGQIICLSQDRPHADTSGTHACRTHVRAAAFMRTPVRFEPRTLLLWYGITIQWANERSTDQIIEKHSWKPERSDCLAWICSVWVHIPFRCWDPRITVHSNSNSNVVTSVLVCTKKEIKMTHVEKQNKRTRTEQFPYDVSRQQRNRARPKKMWHGWWRITSSRKRRTLHHSKPTHPLLNTTGLTGF